MTTKNELLPIEKTLNAGADLYEKIALDMLLKTATRGPVEYNTAGLIKRQKLSVTRRCEIDGQRVQVTASLRFDDECGNKHETFSITGEVRELREDYTTGQEYAPSGDRYMLSCGCVHEAIAAAFPELARFIPWHLVSTPGPMHYAANTLYHAGDKDYNGLRAGEVSSWNHGLRFGNSPITWHCGQKLISWMRASLDKWPGLKWSIEERQHESKPGDSYKYAPHYTLSRGGEAFADSWAYCEFRTKAEADEVAEALNTLIWEAVRIPAAYSEGKPRDLEAARRCAIWPEATDDELCAPDLAEKLAARLPALQARFAADMAALGFTLPESMAALIPA